MPLATAIAGAEVVITSYAVLRLDDAAFHSVRWAGVVLDEAQFVKNRQAKTHVAVRKLGAPFTIAVTGTPLENSLMDLWSLLSLTAPGLYPRPDVFTKNYRKPIESGERPELLDLLRRRIRPLMLRRTKEQVALDLPPKQIQVLPLEPHPVHRHIYDRHLQRERQRVLGLLEDPESNRVAILAALTRLRQLALDPALVDPAHADKATPAKVDFLVDQLARARRRRTPRARLQPVHGLPRAVSRPRSPAQGCTRHTSTGPRRDRQAVVDDFRRGDAVAFLISLKAGGFGLTLTEADYVFVLDPWWNPAAEAQAIDRAHRIGQTARSPSTGSSRGHDRGEGRRAPGAQARPLPAGRRRRRLALGRHHRRRRARPAGCALMLSRSPRSPGHRRTTWIRTANRAPGGPRVCCSSTG